MDDALIENVMMIVMMMYLLLFLLLDLCALLLSVCDFVMSPILKLVVIAINAQLFLCEHALVCLLASYYHINCIS